MQVSPKHLTAPAVVPGGPGGGSKTVAASKAFAYDVTAKPISSGLDSLIAKCTIAIDPEVDFQECVVLKDSTTVIEEVTSTQNMQCAATLVDVDEDPVEIAVICKQGIYENSKSGVQITAKGTHASTDTKAWPMPLKTSEILPAQSIRI